MLRISKALSATKLQDYHSLEFTSPDQSYWSQGQQVQGQWQGRLAERFGLSEPVGELEFQRLSEGQHPQTAEQLVQHRQPFEYTDADGKITRSVEHRAGWDATFSPPKSVSLTALVGRDDRIRAAHGEAVAIALTELERYTQGRLGGNRPAETTGQLIAAKFEHDTARPVDGYAAPQLHTHAVIFNVTQRADGTTRALQEHGFFESQQFATAIYQAELTFRLRELGYEIEPGRSGAPEIRGYSPEYLDASSLRRDQIQNHMEEHGLSGHEAAEIAAHATRDQKVIQSPSEVLAAHRKLAAEFGNQPDRVVAEARARSQGRVQDRTPERMRQVAQEAVTFARERSFEREAVSDERTLFRDALRRGMGETTYAEMRTAFEARVAAGEFRQVASEKYDTGRRFTTPQTLRAEKEILDRMQQGQRQRKPILSIQEAVAHTQRHPELNAAQEIAAEAVLTSPDAVQGLQGFAGAGKTSALKAVGEAAEQKGYIVRGFAPTSRAARQLREAGIEADTLQRFLVGGSPRNTGDPASKRLYMIDESSLASTQQVRDFLRRLDPEDRVLFIGDTRQHQGIEAGKPFEQLVQAGMTTAKLDQIMRQKDPALLRAVEHLSRGEVAEGIALLEQQGRVTEISDPQKRIAAIARSYAVSPDNTLVVSPDNASRLEINDAIRKELQTLGVVETDERKLRALVPRSEMTGADRTWAANYEIGDVLFYQRGSRSFDIEKQSYATVVGVQPKENLLTVKTGNGKQITYNPSRLLGISAYRELERGVAVGDRLQFTAPNRDLGIANRDLGTVEQIDPDGQLSLRMDNGKAVLFDPNEMRHFDHGYALTSYSSQGLTANRVLVNVDTKVHPQLIDSRFAYVAVSRAAEDAHIYTDAAPQLVTSLAQSISKTSAIEMSVELGL